MNSNYITWAVGLLLIVSILIFRRLTSSKNKKTPHDLLQSRYTAGEITIYEYEQQKRHLYKEEDLKTKMFFFGEPI